MTNSIAPSRKTEKLEVRLTPEQKKVVGKLSARTGLSQSQFLLYCLYEYTERNVTDMTELFRK